MTVYGYARVSTAGQTLASQDAQLHAVGCAKVMEKAAELKTDRPELAKVIRRLEPGDVLVVTRLDRLARSTRDLLNVLDAVGKAGAGFQVAVRCLGRYDDAARSADAHRARRPCRVRARIDPRQNRRRPRPCEGERRAIRSPTQAHAPSAPGGHGATRRGRRAGRPGPAALTACRRRPSAGWLRLALSGQARPPREEAEVKETWQLVDQHGIW